MSHPRFARVLVARVLYALPVATLACSSGGDDGGTDPQPVISLSLSPASANIVQGGSATFNAVVTGSGGFNATAAVAVQSLPAGITATVGTPQLTGVVTTAAITVNVGAAVTPGPYTFTVAASGTGVSSVNATFNVTVQSSTTQGFTLAANPAAVNVVRGAAAATTISVNRIAGFAGTVALTATGLPTGVTAAFNPPGATGNSSVLTVTAAASAVLGPATITVRGNSGTLAEQTTTVQVTVSAATGSDVVSLDFSNCSGIIKPVWLAAQDGTGGWTRVVPINDVFTFNVASTKGGYASVTQFGANTTVSVVLRERSALLGTTVFCPAATALKTINVTAMGLATDQVAFVSLGGAQAQLFQFQPFDQLQVPNGTHDLVAYRTVVGTLSASDRALIARDQNLANNANVSLDFGISPITPEPAAFTFTGGQAGDTYAGSMILNTGASGSCSIATLYGFNTTNTAITLYGIPQSARRASDTHTISVTVGNNAASRSVIESFSGFGTRTIAFGAVPAPPTVTNLGTAAYKRLRVVGSVPVEYTTTASFVYTQPTTGKSATMDASIGWLGGNAVDLSFPDLTTVSGWESTWMPAQGSTVNWTFAGVTFNYSGIPCAAGATQRTGRVGGTN